MELFVQFITIRLKHVQVNRIKGNHKTFKKLISVFNNLGIFKSYPWLTQFGVFNFCFPWKTPVIDFFYSNDE